MTIWFLEIEPKGGGYEGRLHQGDGDPGYPLGKMGLGPEAEIEIKGRSYTLGRLVEDLIAFQPAVIDDILDERGQWELGCHLYQETLGRCDRDLPAEAHIQLRVQTEDEHILRLPWTLLARGATFLSMTGWSMAFGGRDQRRDCELPPSPHLLLVMPQPRDMPDTQADAHVTELEERLSLIDPRFRRGAHLHVAHTWDEFRKSVKDRHHEVFYYYGHGVGDVAHSRLCFSREDDRPMADVAHGLREAAGGPPLVAYLNCCQGDAGGVLGAGRQLIGLVPAVVSNRTVAYIDAARKQALEFWQATLLEGKPPHEAIARMYSSLGDMGLSLKNTRWMTPVLHCDYRQWRAHKPVPRNRSDPHLDRDPHWRLKLDRVSQFAKVVYLCKQMLLEQRPRCLAFVWYGTEGQGVDLFHQRLKIELRNLLTEHIYEWQPRWPDSLTNLGWAFEDMMLGAFEVGSIRDIPGRIRGRTGGEAGRVPVIYVRHTPVRWDDPINLNVLQTYLEWWDQVFAPELVDAHAYGLLGISFIVRKPATFCEAMEEKLSELALSHTVVNVLDEMEKLVKKDLRDFVHTHRIPLPHGRLGRILDHVLAQTQGNYDLTLEALKSIEERAWDLESEDGASARELDDKGY